jgi:hypothetical protein
LRKDLRNPIHRKWPQIDAEPAPRVTTVIARVAAWHRSKRGPQARRAVPGRCTSTPATGFAIP